ncbi:Rz1-like lysis system protein LysC [Acinetobacter schindleri]|uniref:Rz1-like lysis system protein LysC n=1 Tax=Acinetobacter schindleri TaxID=108981 RepID=UPI0040647526
MKLKKLLLSAFILSASLQMMACVSPKPPALPQIPASLLNPCDQLKGLNNGTMGELLTRYVEHMEQYAECSAKVDAYIKIHKPSL